MRVVAKIPYKNVTPEIIEKLEHQVNYERNMTVFLDSSTQEIIVVA